MYAHTFRRRFSRLEVTCSQSVLDLCSKRTHSSKGHILVSWWWLTHSQSADARHESRLPPSLSCLLLQIHAPPVMAAYEYLHAAPVFFTSLSRTSLVSAQKGLCIAHVRISPPRLFVRQRSRGISIFFFLRQKFACQREQKGEAEGGRLGRRDREVMNVRHADSRTG